ncbi:MAG TPA: 1-phosphofructokinase [Nonomuraea sp.]|uniref:1-phosphofructokinase n=1 Tax=Nonomuraea sp. NPDC049649 TaxID=3155776 RepID=UPI002CC425A2|nr:1-phosphofructokinase [Nonomuraea sp.]
MIVTLTLNPSLDRTIEIAALDRGAVIRAAAARLDPGGKGVNVSRALLANAVASRAVVPFGGDEGRQLVHLLRQEGLDMVTVPVTGRTRSNVTLAEPDGTVTKINEPGTALSPAELDTIAESVLAEAREADWVVASGSLPPEVPEDVYARLCRRFAGAGIHVAVDTSGPALAAALGGGPALVKPNLEELATATGMAITCVGDVVAAAAKLRAAGARTVLASLGADGAVLVEDGGTWYGEAPVAEPRNAVGAGDAMLAGFLAGGGRGADALVEALAWGAAAVGLPGSRMPGPSDIRRDAVRVSRPDPARLLTSPYPRTSAQAPSTNDHPSPPAATPALSTGHRPDAPLSPTPATAARPADTPRLGPDASASGAAGLTPEERGAVSGAGTPHEDGTPPVLGIRSRPAEQAGADPSGPVPPATGAERHPPPSPR